MAEQLKAQGNECFKKQKYNAAIECYTQAIDVQPSAALFSNRAMCHVKRSLIEDKNEWAAVESDCRRSVELDATGRTAYKAYYNLGMALTKLENFAEARTSFASAKQLLGASDSDSAARLEAAGCALRKAEWEALETLRAARRQDTLQQLQRLLGTAAAADRQEAGAPATPRDGSGAAAADAGVWRGHEEQLAALIGEEAARQQREVPDWLCCKITMDIMRDPVVTPDGISYERSVLLDHLAKNEIDPFTRQPLTKADLRPNYALKEACEEFLRENPWAYPDVQAKGLW